VRGERAPSPGQAQTHLPLQANGARALSTWLTSAAGLTEPWGHQLVTEGWPCSAEPCRAPRWLAYSQTWMLSRCTASRQRASAIHNPEAPGAAVHQADDPGQCFTSADRVGVHIVRKAAPASKVAFAQHRRVQWRPGELSTHVQSISC
jgi:hypothetical protein